MKILNESGTSSDFYSKTLQELIQDLQKIEKSRGGDVKVAFRSDYHERLTELKGTVESFSKGNEALKFVVVLYSRGTKIDL